MNLEVFEGATTAREAVDAAKFERQVRFHLYTDLHSPKGIRALFSHMPEEQSHGLANQIVQATQAKGGFPEFLARKIEEAAQLPYGFLDQPYPVEQLKASMARANAAMSQAEQRGDAAREAIGKRNYDQLMAAQVGQRGVSEEFYERILTKLARLPKT
ncbi:hypothetical protein [Pseudomonas viridiflava]|uniref:hypothetical protein n=1 Tax=Pseudomonas viridiflava TaxID=33069 RepID=UPI000F022589|nr:hypothetical protein [Pseudomonas viridiflava]